MRVLVYGGRTFGDKAALYAKLDALHAARRITCVISGMAARADSLAVGWAYANGVDFESYHADWRLYGKSAGVVRNKKMLFEGKPDVAVAFPGGRGTADMTMRVRKANVELIEVS
jgi:hypothetical protein